MGQFRGTDPLLHRFVMDDKMVLPKKIFLPALEKTWQIEYHCSSQKGVFLVETEGKLILEGKITRGDLSKKILRKCLQKWLIHQGKLHLLPWLESKSRQLDLSYARGKVRCQKTRWASCSEQKVVNLNAKLLLLPTYLVEYVFTHELCHTIHLNHSRQFWALVKQMEPNYLLWEEELSQWERELPPWSY